MRMLTRGAGAVVTIAWLVALAGIPPQSPGEIPRPAIPPANLDTSPTIAFNWSSTPVSVDGIIDPAEWWDARLSVAHLPDLAPDPIRIWSKYDVTAYLGLRLPLDLRQTTAVLNIRADLDNSGDVSQGDVTIDVYFLDGNVTRIDINRLLAQDPEEELPADFYPNPDTVVWKAAAGDVGESSTDLEIAMPVREIQDPSQAVSVQYGIAFILAILPVPTINHTWPATGYYHCLFNFEPPEFSATLYTLSIVAVSVVVVSLLAWCISAIRARR
jgi:hypothetical protein